MQHNTNHRQPGQPIQAPPALLAQVLGRIQQAEQAAEDTAPFSTAFASPDWTRRAAACEQLARIERETALPWLERALFDTHPTVRAWAVHVLGQHQASELVLPTLHDPDWQVREAAMFALGRQNEEPSPEILAPAQSDFDVTVDLTTQNVSRQQLLLSTLSEEKLLMRSTNQPSIRPFSSYSEPHALQEERQLSKKRSPGQQRENISVQRKHLSHFLSFAAAVLVCIALIGSMALVFWAVKGNTPSAGPAPHGSAPEASATPTVIPPECRDVQDQVDETLCEQHKETLLNITRNFSGHIITFVRAYADTSRLLLVYTTTDSPHSDTISFMNVTIQQEIRLAGGGGLQVVYENPATHGWYYLVNFETRDVPAGTTTLHVESIMDAFSGAETPLGFTTPFHTVAFDATQKSVSVKQTETSKGVALTLDHLAFTPDGTFIYLTSARSLSLSPYLNSLSINGQQVASMKETTGSTDPLIIHLTLSLLNKPGSWTVQVMEGRAGNQADGATWIFHFIVADTTQTK